MELIHNDSPIIRRTCRHQWRYQERCLLALLYTSLFILHSSSSTLIKNETSQNIESLTKSNVNLVLDFNKCHNCHQSDGNNNHSISDQNKQSVDGNESLTPSDILEEVLEIVGELTNEYILQRNKTEEQVQLEVEQLLDRALSKEKYEIIDGVEIKSIKKRNAELTPVDVENGRTIFSKFTYEYRLLHKIKNFVDTHILSISLPKAARFIGFRSFGLKKFFLPLLIGAQVFKSILLAMFLPSILGSFGKILGKGISHLSASSSQASYPPANMDEQDPYNENKDITAYETDPAEMYAYPQDSMYANMANANEVNDLGNVDLSRFGLNGQKTSYIPAKNDYYKNQMQAAASNNYKVFQKIPVSSMILSNYDPFYSPLLSRLDGIFSRLGLAPTETNMDDKQMIGGQTVNDVKLESCREQLICLMYASPTKYAPYSNLISAQLSRELNELRRPVSDNPEILRFFRYMRAARRGQEGTDCMKAHPACTTVANPTNTMFAAFHDINKLVTARKLRH